MEDLTATLCTCVAAFAALALVRWYTNPLRSISTVGGPSLPLLSYAGAVRFLRHGKEILQEGYRKYPVFKVAMLDQWLVVVSGAQIIDDVRKRPDEELSFMDGVGEFVQTKYTLGRDIHDDPYHVDLIREKLTRALPAVLPDVIDELMVAVREQIPAEGDGWVRVNALKSMRQIVARASNRVFVGLPTCRNQEYLDIAIGFAMDVVKDRATINLFPNALKPIIGRIVSNTANSVRGSTPHLKPIIEERRRRMAEYGEDWSEKPNDMLQWVVETAAAKGGSDESIIRRILLVNFAAIHTSANAIVHAIYHLAERPGFLQPLREEIEPIIKEEGWTKAGLGKMRKLDSFLKESQRHNGTNLISVMRKTQKDVTLCDGTFIPNGTLVVADAYSTHHDDALYPGADEFDPFRFASLRDKEGERTKHQFVNTSVDYVPFGHGKHACPGRFFAANELKAMLAYIVLNYDMKFEGDGARPANDHWNTIVLAPNADVLFRKRRAAA